MAVAAVGLLKQPCLDLGPRTPGRHGSETRRQLEALDEQHVDQSQRRLVTNRPEFGPQQRIWLTTASPRK